MTIHFFRKTVLATALLLPAFALAGTAKPVVLKVDASSSIKILGDSTLHAWTVNATSLTIGASVKSLGPGSLIAGFESGTLDSLTVSVAVDQLKSTESSGMDKNMRRALESDKFPEISFQIKSYTFKDSSVTAEGSLSIHGVTKDVELKGQAWLLGNGVEVKGSYDLLMSDYGVKPPVMMLGTVRVKDKVSIAYDYQLVPASQP